MATNTKQTSGKIASLAAETLASNSASHTAKQLAASALGQSKQTKETGAKMEDLASKVLSSDKYSADTKRLAGSVLAQSNKKR